MRTLPYQRGYIYRHQSRSVFLVLSACSRHIAFYRHANINIGFDNGGKPGGGLLELLTKKSVAPSRFFFFSSGQQLRTRTFLWLYWRYPKIYNSPFLFFFLPLLVIAACVFSEGVEPWGPKSAKYFTDRVESVRRSLMRSNGRHCPSSTSILFRPAGLQKETRRVGIVERDSWSKQFLVIYSPPGNKKKRNLPPISLRYTFRIARNWIQFPWVDVRSPHIWIYTHHMSLLPPANCHRAIDSNLYIAPELHLLLPLFRYA